MSHATIDTKKVTSTWTSLVDEMMSKLEGHGIPWNQRQIIKEQFREMAKAADLSNNPAHAGKHFADTLMEQIVKIATPKFCGDTSVIINAKVKIWGITDHRSDLNGLIGHTRHPFLKGYNTTGMVGVKLYPGQKVPASIERNELNVEATNIMFIE